MFWIGLAVGLIVGAVIAAGLVLWLVNDLGGFMPRW